MDGVAVRLVLRSAVHLAQAVADRDDAPPRRSLPILLGRGRHGPNLRRVRERTTEVDGIRTWLRERPGDGTPVVFWHGNPTDSDDWIPFMERLDRRSVAADMPGFGRSEAPDPARFPYTVDAYGRWAEDLIRSLGFDRYSLVIHDWGSIGLLPALRNPEKVERIVAFNSVPFGLGYEWHRTARIWRRRGAGELANAISRGRLIDLSLREARPGFRPMPAHVADRIHRNMKRRETTGRDPPPVSLGAGREARRPGPRSAGARGSDPSSVGEGRSLHRAGDRAALGGARAERDPGGGRPRRTLALGRPARVDQPRDPVSGGRGRIDSAPVDHPAAML